MGLKRCPSFSKRPGFPSGLRVLLVDADAGARSQAEAQLRDCSYSVTCCCSVDEALTRLSSAGAFDVLLADKGLAGRSRLLDTKGLPVILMAQDPSPTDIMAGIQQGAVDFLSKPLAPLKLRNIWQHTVRAMMGSMNINCSGGDNAAAAAARELNAMEVIPEEAEEEAGGQQQQLGAAGAAAADRSALVASSVPNVALATASSLYEPTKSLSRCGSAALSDGGANKQQKTRHAPVHSCPSTRSLNSMASCYSNLQLSLPEAGSPDSMGAAAAEASGADGGSAAAAACTPASSPAPAQQQQQRCIKKAVRHPAPGGKPAAGMPALGLCSGATTAGPLPAHAGLGSVPLPTGLGPLPHGMVWGMPMCPLARAPGIVPPAAGPGTAQPAAAMVMPPMAAGMPWGMCGMPGLGMVGMPPPFMAGFGMMAPAPVGMGMPAFAMPFGGAAVAPAAAAAAPVFAAPQFDPAAAAAMPQPLALAAPTAATGAAAAAALSASLGGMGGACAPAAAAAAGAAMDIGEAFDFMLGDIAAEDDLDAGVSGLLDGELASLEQHGLRLPAELQELQALEVQASQQQQQQRAAAAAAARASFDAASAHGAGQRISFDAASAAARQRVSFDCASQQCGGAAQRTSFDCSAVSTTTGARGSFDCSAIGGRPATRAAVRASQRVSFEVNCHGQAQAPPPKAAKPAPAAAAAAGAGDAPAMLLGSMTDLFAACSGDSCSEGSGGMTHVDSCGMLADLQSLFGAGDGAGSDDGCSGSAGAAAAAAAGLFDDVMDELPLEAAMRKSSSLAELINAGLAPMRA